MFGHVIAVKSRALVGLRHRQPVRIELAERDARVVDMVEVLALGKGHAVIAVEAHHLAGRLHLGAKHRVDPSPNRSNGKTAAFTPTCGSA